MKPILPIALLSLCTCFTNAKEAYTLWYTKPAIDWQSEALPLGNGKMGISVLGGVAKDTIILNEDSLWSGNANERGAYSTGPTGDFGSFQPFGALVTQFEGQDTYSQYQRKLHLLNGVHITNYSANDTDYKREFFVSYPAKTVVLNYSANKPGAYTGTFALTNPHEAKVVYKDNTISYSGQLHNGLHFTAKAIIINKGGELKSTDQGIQIQKSDEITVIISLATEYTPEFSKNWVLGENYEKDRIDTPLNEAVKLGYEKLKSDHIKDFGTIMNRVQIDIGTTIEELNIPTNERLVAYQQNPVDPDLIETMFQYGRYLLLSCSRADSLPANMQGLWNDNPNPPSGSDYHTDLNMQMAYWLAQTCNLAESDKPFIDFIKSIAEPSRLRTAKKLQSSDANFKGWMLRNALNIYGGQGKEWNATSSAWMINHIWDMYQFSLNKEFLKKEAYPLMKEMCEFWLPRLKPLQANGTNFENYEGKQGDESLKETTEGTLVIPKALSTYSQKPEDGTSHEMQILWELFDNTLQASTIVGDKQFGKTLKEALDKMPAPKVGKWGQLMEWMIDRDDPENKAQFPAHLYAVYPGRQISLNTTPELAQAALKTFESKTELFDAKQPWIRAWSAAIWARLGKGSRAYADIKKLIQFNTLPNLITTGPPIRMEGNFGITAAMAEMFVQSHAGKVELLPAIPKAWPNGSIKGLKVRGNKTIDIIWKDGKIEQQKIY